MTTTKAIDAVFASDALCVVEGCGRAGQHFCTFKVMRKKRIATCNRVTCQMHVYEVFPSGTLCPIHAAVEREPDR